MTSFDPKADLDANADLKAAFGHHLGAASRHYFEFGFEQGRQLTLSPDDFGQDPEPAQSAPDPQAQGALLSSDEESFKVADDRSTSFRGLAGEEPSSPKHGDDSGIVIAAPNDETQDPQVLPQQVVAGQMDDFSMASLAMLARGDTLREVYDQRSIYHDGDVVHFDPADPQWFADNRPGAFTPADPFG